MDIDRRQITKRQALKPYAHIKGLKAREVALAMDLGVERTTVTRWALNEPIPKAWAIIIVNLLHPDIFKEPSK